MARRRNRTEDDTTTGGNSNMSTTETNIVPIDEDFIQSLLSKARPRGIYDEELAEFLASGQRGARASTGAGARLEGKSASSVKTGLENAKKRALAKGDDAPEGLDNVKIVLHKENENDAGTVYMINPNVAAS